MVCKLSGGAVITSFDLNINDAKDKRRTLVPQSLKCNCECLVTESAFDIDSVWVDEAESALCVSLLMEIRLGHT